VPRQADLGFGQRAGLVRAQYIHAAEVVDRAEPLDDDMRAGHAQGAARERDRDNHRQQFGCEPDREGDGKWKARKPGPVEQQIDQQHEQHQDLGEPDDQQPEPAGALIERGGRRRPPQRAANLAKLGCQAGAANQQPGRAVHH